VAATAAFVLYGTVVNAPANIGLNEKQAGQQVSDVQNVLERVLAQVARDKAVEITPLRAILGKLGEAGVLEEDIPKRLDEKADELIKLRQEIARLRPGPAELASSTEKAETLIKKGDLDGARTVLADTKVVSKDRGDLEVSFRVNAGGSADAVKVPVYARVRQGQWISIGIAAKSDLRDGRWHLTWKPEKLATHGDPIEYAAQLDDGVVLLGTFIYDLLNSCGYPLVPDGTVTGDIEGKATFIQSFIGDIALSGQIELAMNDLFQRYPNADQLRLKQYFLYVICWQIMTNTKLDTLTKVEAYTNASAALLRRPPSIP
jgi:hypothetical protein